MAAAGAATAFCVTPLASGRATVEDGPVEAASAIMFLMASAAGLARVFREGGVGALTIVSALALLAALDEMSFGARHLGWEPYLLAGVPVDGAHDFLKIAWRLLQWSPTWLKAVALATALVGALAAGWLAWRLRLRIEAAWSRTDQPLVVTAVAAAVFVAAGQLLDIAPSSTLGARAAALEETLELAGAILTLAATTGVAGRLCGAAAVR